MGVDEGNLLVMSVERYTLTKYQYTVLVSMYPNGLVGNPAHLLSAEVVSSILVKIRICVLSSVTKRT